MVDVKFCGMTRAKDASLAVSLEARYVGVIFAESRRQVTAERAREVLSPLRDTTARSVGVFGGHSADGVLALAERAGVDVVQLHGWTDPAAMEALRARFGGEVWAVTRIVAGELDASVAALFGVVDGVVLDSFSPKALGGTGESFAWDVVAPRVAAARGSGPARLVVAGGLTPENVGRAVQVLSPDVVDVASGVESAPGIKDPARMRAFVDAARERVTR